MPPKKKTKRDHGEGSVYKRGNIWWIGYTVDGQQKNESSGSRDKEVARQLLRERLAAIGQGKGDQFHGWLFSDIANDWYASVEAPGTLSESSLHQWRIYLDRHILPVFGDSYLQHLLDVSQYEDYATAKLRNKANRTKEPLPVGTTSEEDDPQPSKPLAPSTVSQHLTVLSMVFDFAVRRGKIHLNPIKSVSRKMLTQSIGSGLVEPFEREETQKLINTLTKAEDKFLVYTLAQLGLRIGEAFALKVSAYNSKDGTLKVGATVKRKKNGAQFLETRKYRKRGKTHSAVRTLKLSDEFVAELDAHIARMREKDRIPPEGQDDGFIFPNLKGGMKHVGNWRNRVWNKAVVAADLHDDSPDSEDGRPTPHKLRHTYASEQIAEKVSLDRLCYRMGHSNPQTTLGIYTHIFKRNEQDIADIAGVYDMSDDQPADAHSGLKAA